MPSPPADDDLEFHPRHTPALVGHAAAEAELARAWASGRMPHAWLLAGPRGIGKATLAYRFARTVLASAGGGGASLFGADPQPRPSPASREERAGARKRAFGATGEGVPADHPVFRRIAAQAHPDLSVVETGVTDKGVQREGIVVEDARTVVPFFAHTAADGGWRVAIIDAADEMNAESANALLKVVEEPPSRGLILLVAHRPGFVLPTIRSRTRLLRMKPLAPADVALVLNQRWPELPLDDVRALMAMAEGSPGRAIALAETDGVGFYREMQGWLTKLPSLDVPSMHRMADRLTRREIGRSFRVLAGLPEWWLVRAIRSMAGHPPQTEVLPGEIEVFERVLGRRNLEHWVGVWEKVSLLLARGIALNLDRRQMALNIFSALGRAARS